MNSEIGDELRKKGSLSLSIEDTNLVGQRHNSLLMKKKDLMK